MSCTKNVRSGLVNLGMDSVGSWNDLRNCSTRILEIWLEGDIHTVVESSVLASVDNFAIMIDTNKVFVPDEGKMHA